MFRPFGRVPTLWRSRVSLPVVVPSGVRQWSWLGVSQSVTDVAQATVRGSVFTAVVDMDVLGHTQAQATHSRWLHIFRMQISVAYRSSLRSGDCLGSPNKKTAQTQMETQWRQILGCRQFIRMVTIRPTISAGVTRRQHQRRPTHRPIRRPVSLTGRVSVHGNLRMAPPIATTIITRRGVQRLHPYSRWYPMACGREMQSPRQSQRSNRHLVVGGQAFFTSASIAQEQANCILCVK